MPMTRRFLALSFVVCLGVPFPLRAGETTETATLRQDGAAIVKGRGEVSATVERTDDAAGRAGALMATYDFSACPDRKNSFFRVEARQPLRGLPRSFTLTLRSDPPEQTLPMGLWLQDRTGEVYLARFKHRGTGWQTVKVDMPKRPVWKSGDGNGKPDLPLVYHGLLLDMPEAAPHRGRFFVAPIEVELDTSTVDFDGRPDLPSHFADGRKPELALPLVSRKLHPPEAYVYELSVTDTYRGRVVHQKTAPLFDADGKIPAALPLPVPYGHYAAAFRVLRDGTEVVGHAGRFSHFMPAPPPRTEAERRYEFEYSPLGGVFANFPPEMANRYGAGWHRSEIPSWREIETAPGVFDFAAKRKQIAGYADANVRSILLQTLYHYPKFRAPDASGRFSPDYGRYLGAAAKALGDRLRHFELGNEDNGHTKFLYTEVARHGAAAVRAAQPFALVANSGTAFIDHNWLAFQAERGLLDRLDALCVHPYTNNSTPSQKVGPEKAGVLESLRRLHDLADRAGGMKQLWATEYGWPNNAGPTGEHDRADLYVREMFVGDAAGLLVNGLYTWNRDYNVVGYPAGVAIQAFARMRQGRRFAGLVVDGDVWIAVYERGGEATAAVWTPEDGERRHEVAGREYFDLFGNPLERSAFRITQSPSYIRGLDPRWLAKAAADTAARAAQRFRDNHARHPVPAFVAAEDDPDRQRQTLRAWSKDQGPVDTAEQATVARFLEYHAALARFAGTTDANADGAATGRAEALRQQIRSAHAGHEDLPQARYLLEVAERLRLEAELSGDAAYRARGLALADVTLAVAERFARDGRRTQYAVFANLYRVQGDELSEKIAFVPGGNAFVRARVSSYAREPLNATVRPVLPSGWRAIPESREVATVPGEPVFADFQFVCPARPEARNRLALSVELPGKAPAVTVFNDIEIVPAVTLSAAPLTGPLPDAPLELVVRNREDAAVAGHVIVNSPEGNVELARAAFEDLPPFGERRLTLSLAKVTPELARTWSLQGQFKLRDGREFRVPFEIDFVHAGAMAPPPAIDADLSEWSSALPLKIADAEYTLGSYGDGWTPEDCSGTARLGWDRQNLYFACEVKDQTFNQQHTGQTTWQQDSVQIVLAPAEGTAFSELTFALTPAGPQVWSFRSNRVLTEAAFAATYRDGVIRYEAAIPWSAHKGLLDRVPEDGAFRFAIALNDDDAVTPRRFLERFKGSIVHGKRPDTFARVALGGTPPPAPAAADRDGVAFADDFAGEADGGKPLKWTFHRNNMPESAIEVATVDGVKVLRLNNPSEAKPNHFAICFTRLQLEPGAKYRLRARVKNAPEDGRGLLGVCADRWGNKDQKYAVLKPSPEWREVELGFTAPVSGECNLIVRNAKKLDNLLIAALSVTRLP